MARKHNPSSTITVRSTEPSRRAKRSDQRQLLFPPGILIVADHTKTDEPRDVRIHDPNSSRCWSNICSGIDASRRSPAGNPHHFSRLKLERMWMRRMCDERWLES